MGSLTRNQLGFFVSIWQIYVIFDSGGVGAKPPLFPAPEEDAYVGIEEEGMLGDEVDEGYLAEEVLFGQTDLDGGNGLVHPAIIKAHRLFCVDGRLDL